MNRPPWPDSHNWLSHDPGTVQFGDTAIVTFHLASSSAQSPSLGRRTFVLRRIENRWRIVHLHASTSAGVQGADLKP